MRSPLDPARLTLSALLLAFSAVVSVSCTGSSDDCGPAAPDDDPDADDEDPFEGLQDIQIQAEPIEINELAAGATTQVEIALTNAGDRVLTISDISLTDWTDPNFSIPEDAELPGTLEPGEAATVPVDYVASAGRDVYAGIDVLSDDPDEPRVSAGIVGRSPSGGPSARTAPPVVDFGFTFIGDDKRLPLTVTNEGGGALFVTEVELIQSPSQPHFGLNCPGETLADCSFEDEVLPDLIATPIAPGESLDIEVSFRPLNLSTISGQVRVATNDPARPELLVTVRGNGETAPGCTPPTVELVSPTTPQAWQPGQGGHLQATVIVADDQQPPESMLVEIFSGEFLVEDEFPDSTGTATFDVDLDAIEEPAMPMGRHSFTVKVSDSCPQYAFTQFVGFYDVPEDLTTDGDGDGWPEGFDCVDNNAVIYPGALEVADGLDNDCDGIIDEGTDRWDDDCDGFCEDATTCLGQGPPAHGGACSGLAPEPYGDCDDSDDDQDGDNLSDGRARAPGADEVANHIDDDCDGATDEGTTLRDDDGDGLSEVAGDCDDDDATVFTGAPEACDELDNDCDGDVDDDCLEDTAPPRVLGDVVTERYRVRLGADIEAEVQVLDPTDDLTYAWSTDQGSFVGDSTGPIVTWRAPADTDNNAELDGRFAVLLVTVTDSQGRAATTFGNLLMATEALTPNRVSIGGGDPCGCAFGAQSRPPLALGPVLFLGALALRRRTSARRSAR